MKNQQDIIKITMSVYIYLYIYIFIYVYRGKHMQQATTIFSNVYCGLSVLMIHKLQNFLQPYRIKVNKRAFSCLQFKKFMH